METLKLPKVGILPSGKKNKISDVSGVKVGHFTINNNDVQTGVTAILPGEDNPFLLKYPSAVHVINGFGKSTGLIQIKELGLLETPIILTNTLSVGSCINGLNKYMLNLNSCIGNTTGTVNSVVMECNDMKLNNIRKMIIKDDDVIQAINDARVDFEEGAIGAGRGMKCYDLKGGIGSSSRVIEFGNRSYVLGALVLTNHGKFEDLTIDGKQVGRELSGPIDKSKDKGSVITIIATDLPLSSRQLNRICRRVVVGLSQSGSIVTNGSGEISLAFSTANRVPHEPKEFFMEIKIMDDNKMDVVFRAVKESVEEAVLKSLFEAREVTGRDGVTLKALSDIIPSGYF